MTGNGDAIGGGGVPISHDEYEMYALMYVIHIQKPLSFFIDRPPGMELQKSDLMLDFRMGKKGGGVFFYTLCSPFYSYSLLKSVTPMKL